jgi:DNA-binding YbaB/EbfC family protein
MFGKLGDIANMMKHAKELQGKIKEMQDGIGNARYEAQSGAGAVTAVVSGKLELVSLKISPETVKAGDVEMLEDLVKSAVCAAQRKAADSVAQEMQKLTGGMGLPGLDSLMNGAT